MFVSILDQSVVADPIIHGGEGAGLISMYQQGLNVPPALIIPTHVCVEYRKSPKGTMKKIAAELKLYDNFFKEIFGYQPLLSVRSGARASMPGMLETILNVGLDNKTLSQWEARIGEDCAVNSFKRLVVMHGNVVHSIPRKDLESETLPEALALYERKTGQLFPKAQDQILSSIEAVFKSWNNERAKTYRKLNNIPDDWGTAVVLQAMVFGNLNNDSGTGVLFTRDPDSGENEVVGEFLINAQGEDVVAGTATPMKLSKLAEWNPKVAEELITTVTKLEKIKGDVQDVEFTIQDRKLYILQTRTAKRSAFAAVKIAMSMMAEGLLTAAQSIARVAERELDLANQPVIDPKFHTPYFAMGIPACSGVVTGIVCLSSVDAINLAKIGQKVVLVTGETTPDDIGGMNAAVGILTMTGGSTSHAAVVARSMNRCCVVGLGESYHNYFKAGATVSLDGATGRVWLGEVPVVGGNNPMVGAFRSLKVGSTPLLVSDAPDMQVPALCLEIGSILHLTNAAIEGIVLKCKKACLNLSLSYTPGESAVFMTDTDIKARQQWVAGLLDGLVSYKVITYGFKWNELSTTLSESPSLEELVMSTTDVFVKSNSLNWGVAEQRVMNWLKLEGVTVSVWNTKGSPGPAAYSVVSQ